MKRFHPSDSVFRLHYKTMNEKKRVGEACQEINPFLIDYTRIQFLAVADVADGLDDPIVYSRPCYPMIVTRQQ